MRVRTSIVTGLALASLLLASPARAACRALTEADALAGADLIFEGVSQPGDLRADGTLATPARFSVLQYLKGDGPRVVSVTDAPGVDAMHLLSGEGWVIYGRGSSGGAIATSPCFGSYLLSGPKPFASPAPSPTAPSPAPSPTVRFGPGGPDDARVSWGVAAGAGVLGLALVMTIGYLTARLVVRTT
jgi:hypothetical protein